ncbi:MAG TPA: thermonuclease family protein [Kaistia sp.]|nr:thermonuclease family protein [Kaistia sp.]
MKSGFLAFCLSALLVGSAAASDLTAVDGDTVRLGDERIRIIGLDAPELHARCRAEKRLAERARDRMAELISGDHVEVIRSTRKDKYRRTLAIIRVNGVDVARVMIFEGLARPYHGERRQSWCDAPAPQRRPS